MNRALVTFGVGPHAELLKIALPSFEAFAGEHDYELLVAQPEPCDRPPSWWKVPILLDALDSFDEVLWLDADIVIVDASQDLPIQVSVWQALVEHQTGDGAVPNLGCWYLRQPMYQVLERMWGMTEYVTHPWWEQAAMLDLLGYRLQRPTSVREGTTLQGRTQYLDAAWNVHRNDSTIVERPRFQHATMWPDRAAQMREWARKVKVPA
jgi:hypothetical protein